MRDTLMDKEHPVEYLAEHLDVRDQITVNSKELFEAGFQFPSIVQYDNVQTLLTELQNSQDNLN